MKLSKTELLVKAMAICLDSKEMIHDHYDTHKDIIDGQLRCVLELMKESGLIVDGAFILEIMKKKDYTLDDILAMSTKLTALQVFTSYYTCCELELYACYRGEDTGHQP